MIGSITKKIQTNPIIRSSIVIGIITMGAKVLGYVEKLILAYFFGTSYKVDVYNVIVTIVISIFVFFREIIEPGFLNSFLKAKEKKDEKGAWSLFNSFLRYILLVTVILSLFVYFYPAAIIRLFAPGFEGQEKELATSLIKIAFPACIFLSLSALTNITLNGLKRFSLPASGELLFKAGIITSLFLFYQYLNITAAILGLLLGAAFKLGTHLIGLYKKVSFTKNTTQPVYLQNTWRLSWPLLVGLIFSLLSSLIDNVIASTQQEGVISALSYAWKLIEFPVILFPYILSVVVFPYFAELSIAKEKERLSQLLWQSLSWILILFLPLSLYYFTFGNEMVEVVFKRGAFDNHSVLLTAIPLKYYSTGLVFFAIETILVIFYFANGNTRAPIFVGIACVIEKIILAYALIQVTGYAGIALAHVISKATKNIILLVLLHKEGALNFKAASAFVYKVALACAVAAFSMIGFKYLFHYSAEGASIKKLWYLGSALFTGAAVYTLALFALKPKFSYK